MWVTLARTASKNNTNSTKVAIVMPATSSSCTASTTMISKRLMNPAVGESSFMGVSCERIDAGVNPAPTRHCRRSAD